MAKQPNMTTHQSLPAATGNLINPTVTPTCPTVIPDLIGDLRTDSLAPGARRKDAKCMTMGTCYAGFPGHAD